MNRPKSIIPQSLPEFNDVTLPAFHSTLTHKLSGGELEATLGKYAVKKLGKKTKQKEGITQEEFYIVKILWLIKMAKVQCQTQKYNLNNLRITIEKVTDYTLLCHKITLRSSFLDYITYLCVLVGLMMQ